MIMVPGITVLQAMLRSAEEAATRLDVETTAGGVHNATEIEHVIKSFAQKPNGGLVVLPYAVTVFNASTIIAMARQYQLPDIYALAEFVSAGGFPPVRSRRRKQNISRSKGDRAVAQQQSEVNYGDTALLEVRKKRRTGRG